MDLIGHSSPSAMLDSLPPELHQLPGKEYALLREILGKVFLMQQAAGNVDESLYESDAETRGRVKRVRELVYDIDDSVHLFAARVDASGGRSNAPCHGIFRWIHIGRRNLPVRIFASELQKLREHHEELSEERTIGRRLPMPIREEPLSEDPVHPRRRAYEPSELISDGGLVGLDGPTEEVIKMVTGAGAGGEAEAELKIVTIVGMPGSGKTTLAAAVYQQLIRHHNCFQLHAFISVGPRFVVELAVLDMLSHLGDEHQQQGPFESDEDFMDMIRGILENRRYIIVFDDLWRSKDWETIKHCFPENSPGGRIITTTRSLELAEGCCRSSSDCIYTIGLLNDVDSKKLILDTAFGIGHGCPKHLEDVLAQVARRCSGLPLALVTVPSMIEDKFSKDEWDRLVGSRWSSHPHAKGMKQILNLSYIDLPINLRTYLLDLSIFPEDFKLDVDRLTRRWIAARYNLEMHSFFGEEIARRCIHELISRNMVQRLPPVHGAPGYCSLHPVIHDFVVCKSMEENFVTVVGDEMQSPPILSDGRVYRRLSVQRSEHDHDLPSYDEVDLSHVRSITVFGQARAAPRLTNLHVVRVLDLEGCVGPVCLDDLDKLPLLRYLSLKGTDVAELPAALWELKFLESLDVRSTKLKQLPPGVVELRDTLKTLLFSCENSVETTTGIAKHCHRLQNLGTLDLREHRASFVKDLGNLDKLRVIEITWSFSQCTDGAYCDALRSSMEKWTKLRSLTIRCGGVGCPMEFLGSLSYPPKRLEEFKVTAGVFVSFPDWITELRSLSILQITICKIVKDLNSLRGLPRLECLILGLDFVPRNAIVIESEGFSELLSFSVDCPVPWLKFHEGAMPKLTHLQLEFCSGSTNPESVPSNISNLQKLKEVVLVYNQKWCGDSSSVKNTVNAVKKQVAQHRNLIDLIINDTKVDVQEVNAEMKSTTEIQSAEVSEETARTIVEPHGEIEMEAECEAGTTSSQVSGQVSERR